MPWFRDNYNILATHCTIRYGHKGQIRETGGADLADAARGSVADLHSLPLVRKVFC